MKFKHKTKLAIFDIDGTLTDSVPIHKSAFTRALLHIGVEHLDSNFNGYKHHTDSYIARTAYEKTGKPFEENTFEQLSQKLTHLIAQSSISEINGAKKALDFWDTETEYWTVFATGSLKEPALFKLQQIGVNPKPWQLVTADDFQSREEIVNQAISLAHQHTGVAQFEHIISIGDGLWDLRTAQNLNLDFMGIGPIHKEVLAANGCVLHFDNWETFDFATMAQTLSSQ